MVTATLPARTLLRALPLALLGLTLTAPAALAQNDESEARSSRVVIRMDADSIHVERDGETTVVPNTLEGRAQLDAEDFSGDDFFSEDFFGEDGFDVERFGLRFGAEDFPFEDEGGVRVFRFRGEGPHRFGPRFAFDFDDDVSRLRVDAGAQAETMEMELRAQRLARELRAADGDTQAELEAELDDLLAQLFERKLEQRRARVEALEDDLREQQERLEAREAARDEIIERRKRELLGDDVLDW